jgi:hypothetical protein
VVVVETDQGNGYLKALGNRAGTHSLAVELVATRLAGWFGLPTLTASTVWVTNVPPIELEENPSRLALPGPAFITREEEGTPSSGAPEILDLLDNPEDVSRLVVFDTWVRNCDRHMPRPAGDHLNRSNVFLSAEGATKGRFILKPIDHAQCFCFLAVLTPEALRAPAALTDQRMYGYFPEFRGWVSEKVVRAAVDQTAALTGGEAENLFRGIPAEWEISEEIRSAWIDLIRGRATYLRQNVDNLCSQL